MTVISSRIVHRIVEASRGPDSTNALLARAGLPPNSQAPQDEQRLISADVYYDLLERAGADDASLPLRYADAIRPEDFGAFGLAIKTARDVRDALQRLARYILVVSDTLDYALQDDAEGPRFVLQGRPSGVRQGIALANECALAAIVSLLRQVAAGPFSAREIWFRHSAPTDTSNHAAWFEAPIRFDAPTDALLLTPSALAIPTRLADDGLSSYLLSQLEEIHAQRSEAVIVQQVRKAITDKLCAGLPARATIARDLGMGGRTLHRRLAEHDLSYQDVATQVRRETAESLLAQPALSLVEIAYLTGFSDQSAFQRAFKTWTGTTPRTYRAGAR